MATPPGASERVADRYDYRDAKELRYTVVRYEPKRFAIEDPGGQPLPDPLPPHLAMLYRLPEVLAAPPGETVHLCEGEKDADALHVLDLVATTMPCGTRLGWLPSFTPCLAGRHVAILPDADGPGREHARKVAGALAGVAASVVIVDLHESRRGPWDVTDWLGPAHDADVLAARVRRARYQAAGLDGLDGRRPPKKATREDLIFASRLTTTEKMVLLAIQHLLGWPADGQAPAARSPRVSAIAQRSSVHRVTAQNAITQLRRAGVLDMTLRVAWDILAATRRAPAQADATAAPEMREDAVPVSRPGRHGIHADPRSELLADARSGVAAFGARRRP